MSLPPHVGAKRSRLSKHCPAYDFRIPCLAWAGCIGVQKFCFDPWYELIPLGTNNRLVRFIDANMYINHLCCNRFQDHVLRLTNRHPVETARRTLYQLLQISTNWYQLITLGLSCYELARNRWHDWDGWL